MYTASPIVDNPSAVAPACASRRHRPEPPRGKDRPLAHNDVLGRSCPVEEAPCIAYRMSHERKLGDTELSYYLPSRADGVNDMYLHVGFRAPASLVTDERIRIIWAMLIARHPMLVTEVRMDDGQYDNARYRHLPSDSSERALAAGASNLRILVGTKDEVILGYLNGPRLLSNNQPAYLLIARDPSTYKLTSGMSNGTGATGQSANVANMGNSGHLGNSYLIKREDQASIGGALCATPAAGVDEALHEFHFCLCAAHFLGDGMALHKTANQFFLLLGSSKTDGELLEDFHTEWATKWKHVASKGPSLPKTIESKLPPTPDSRFARAAARIDFQNLQRKVIGGHGLPRRKLGPRSTVVPTISFTPEATQKALARCKENGVTISHAVFALCNLVWAKMKAQGNDDLPTMMYGAINLRSYVPPLEESHFYLAVTYFNIILPSFIPRALEESRVLWLRSKSAKEQMNAVVKSPLFVHRTHEMAAERRRMAIAWAKEDDQKEKKTWDEPPRPSSCVAPQPTKVPSQALLGLSMLGNLDGIYEHKNFPSVTLHTLTTGSRQREGAMLLFAYTFAWRLWLSLGYDYNGFERELVEKFWDGLTKDMRRHIVGEAI